MKQRLSLAGFVVAALLLAAPAAAQENTDTGPPLEFDLPSSYIPSPGLCRVFYPDAEEESSYMQAQGCNGIENAINVADMGPSFSIDPRTAAGTSACAG